MVHDPKSGSLVPIDFRHLTDHVPELRNFGYELHSISFDPVNDSSNIDPGVWVKMAEIIENGYDEFDGFVILHGTDTMAYSDSAKRKERGNLSSSDSLQQREGP